MYLQPHYSNGVFGSVLKIKFVDQLWRSITSEISFEDKNPRYHSKEGVTWRQPFGRMLKIDLNMDYEAILKIKFVDQLWRSIASEISFEDQNP